MQSKINTMWTEARHLLWRWFHCQRTWVSDNRWILGICNDMHTSWFEFHCIQVITTFIQTNRRRLDSVEAGTSLYQRNNELFTVLYEINLPYEDSWVQWLWLGILLWGPAKHHWLLFPVERWRTSHILEVKETTNARWHPPRPAQLREPVARGSSAENKPGRIEKATPTKKPTISF